MVEQNWTEVEPGVWKPENVGDSIEGVYILSIPRDVSREISARHYIENEKGKFLVWGSVVIDDRLSLVSIGSIIKIVYKGKTKNQKNQDIKIFQVLVKK